MKKIILTLLLTIVTTISYANNVVTLTLNYWKSKDVVVKVRDNGKVTRTLHKNTTPDQIIEHWLAKGYKIISISAASSGEDNVYLIKHNNQ